MTFGEFGQLLTGIAALMAAVTSIRNGRKIEEVHKATNSMKDELVAVTKLEAFAAGMKSGQDKAP